MLCRNRTGAARSAFDIHILFNVTCRCPFNNALSSGLQYQAEAEQRTVELIAKRILIQVGDPAHVFWQSISVDNDTKFTLNRSVALLAAQQFYVDEINQWTELDGRSPLRVTSLGRLWQLVTPTVPIEYRCRPQPQCDATYR